MEDLADKIRAEQTDIAMQYQERELLLNWVKKQFMKGRDVVEIPVTSADYWGTLSLSEKFFFGPDCNYPPLYLVCFSYLNGRHYMHPCNNTEISADVTESDIASRYAVNDEDVIAKKTILNLYGFSVKYVERGGQGDVLQIRR